MSRLRKKIEGGQRDQPIAGIDEASEVSGKSRRIARDIENLQRGKATDGSDHFGSTAAPGRIENDRSEGRKYTCRTVVLSPASEDGDVFHGIAFHVMFQTARRWLP